MNTNHWRLAIALILGISFQASQAYELATHAKMTDAAFAQSTLGNSDKRIQRQIGIDVWSVLVGGKKVPFRANGFDQYLDNTGSEIRYRIATDYDGNIIAANIKPPPGAPTEEFSERGWLLRGAIREDDASTFVNLVGRNPKEPQDDPYNNFNRFCNHFFDPLAVPLTGPDKFGRSLTGFCFLETPLYDNPQWALGSLTPFDVVPAEFFNRRNHFSVLDAREAMWRALTLRNRAGIPLDTVSNSVALENLRKTYWATAFRALGDVVHLIQDMAQPQHTRNEGHGLSNTGYEEYIDARARNNAREFVIDGQTLSKSAIQLPDLNYTGYPTPTFNRYSDFWSTRVNSPNAFGLADYSNRGFFTLASNYPNTIYPQPSSNSADYQEVRKPSDYFGVQSIYIFGTVLDDIRNSVDGVTMATVGTFPISAAPGFVKKSTLSKRNYDDRANLLIPRAVAYSAGLIDYFFRGRLDFKVPDENVYAIADHSDANVNNKISGGFAKLKVKVKNITDPVTPPGSGAIAQKMTSGNLVAIVKFKRNNCYVPDSMQGQPGGPLYSSSCRTMQEEIVVSNLLPLPSGIDDAYQSATFDFVDSQRIPINAVDVSLQIAFRGTLGTETDAVVVETKSISEPSFFSMENFTDCRINTDGSAVKVPGENKTFNFRFHDPLTDAVPATDIGSVVDMLPGKFARVALLTDNYSYKKQMRSDYSYSADIALNDTTATTAPIANPVQWEKGRPLLSGGNLYEHDGFGYYPGLATDTGLTGSQRCTANLFPGFTATPVPLTTLAF